MSEQISPDRVAFSVRQTAIALQGGFVHRRLAQLGAAATLEPRRYVFVRAPDLFWTHQGEASGGDTTGAVSCVVEGGDAKIAPDFLCMVARTWVAVTA
ncbi:unnamed protein product [Parajaminaea phylloscopi]